MLQFNTKGSIVLPNVNAPDRVQSVLLAIEKGLISARARKVQIDDESIVFRGGVLRLVSNINLLAPITKGRVSVHLEPDVVKLNYELWFTELLVLGIVASCFLSIYGLAGMRLPPSSALCLGLFAFTFLFGVNILIAKSRFRAFLIKCAGQSGSSMP